MSSSNGTMTNIEEFQEGNMPDSIRGLKEHLPDRRVRDSAEWMCEHGIRSDDMAMVFQFFPKRLIPGAKDDAGKPVDLAGWSEEYGMDKRLERALLMFDSEDLNAKFIDMTNSFNVIVGDLGDCLDPWPIVEKFFASIESPTT